MRKVINFLIILSVFLDSAIIIREPVNLFLYYFFYLIFLLIFLITYKKIKLDKSFFLLILSITVISVVNSYLNEGNTRLVYKQLFAIIYSAITFYFFIIYNDYDVVKIFRNYLNISFYVCIIGLFQEFSFLINFPSGYDLSYILSYWHLYVTEYEYYIKINSIVSEPSHLAIALAPALFVSIDRLFDSKNTLLSIGRAFTILITYFLTGSALAVIAVITAIILLAFKYSIIKVLFYKKYIPYTIPIIILCVFLGNTIYEIPFIKLRINDSVKILYSNSYKTTRDLNLSTFALYSNFVVARESFKKNPVFGSGIGTHSENYDKYIHKFFHKDIEGVRLEMNKDDGNSMFIRLLSELGLFGVLGFFYFIYKHRISFSDINLNDYNLWVINSSILLFFILRLIRFGNYSLLGFFLFAFLYYFSKKQYKINLQHQPLTVITSI